MSSRSLNKWKRLLDISSRNACYRDLRLKMQFTEYSCIQIDVFENVRCEFQQRLYHCLAQFSAFTKLIIIYTKK